MIIVLALAVALIAAEARSPRSDVPRVGVIASRMGYQGFQNGLRALFYTDGEDIQLEFRSTEGREGRLGDLAATLAAMNVDVIVAVGTNAVLAAKQATSTIPIVMLAAEPVDVGLVANPAKPEGNVTGLSFNEDNTSAKRLELLKEAVPSAARVVALTGSLTPVATRMLRDTEAAAKTLGVELHALQFRSPETLDKTFAAIAEKRGDSLIVLPAAGMFAQRAQIITLAIRNKLPAMFWRREFVDIGGLMSYGPDLDAMYRRAAEFVRKILQGAKPADLPVEQPNKFELGLNLKTAKALGLTFPRSVILQADHVVE